MKAHLLILCVVVTGRLTAQEAPAKQPAPDPIAFHVLAESVVKKADGGTVTFRQVAPPAVLPVAPMSAPAPQQPTAAQMERLRRVAMKEQQHLTISATVYEGGPTLLSWSCGGKHKLLAWSNVDFRFLPDWASVETESAVYSFLKTMRPAVGLTHKQTAQMRLLPTEENPTFVMLDGRMPVTAEEQHAIAGMTALHDYYQTNHEMLMRRYAQQQSDQAAREQEDHRAPPPLPKHEVIHFWPLPKPAQTNVRGVKNEGGTK